MHTISAKSPAAQFYALLIGPFAWAGDLGCSYAFVYHACSTGHHYVLHVITGLALLFALTGAFVGWHEFRAFRDGHEEGGSPLDRSYFMAVLGIASGLGFALVIVATAVPKFVFSPCQ
jgi:RsiW-degrading membrane proteinase PrsW (M82 family)